MKTQTSNKSSSKGRVRDLVKKQEEFTVQPINHEQELPDNIEDFSEQDIEYAAEELENDFEEAVEESEITNSEPKDFVKVKFSKLVQLVASHNFEEVLKSNPDEEVILSSNLLTDLAGSHDSREVKKIPLVFLVGLAIGVALSYILLIK